MAITDGGHACLDAAMGEPGHVCRGEVTGRPSHAGTGTTIYRCEAGHERADEHYRETQERYPDSPIAPDWFDPADAGESWDEPDPW